jgi:endogenous inhibitor of DNA gyrase (YacG/DUF329 family)
MGKKKTVGVAPCHTCGTEIVSHKMSGFFPFGDNGPIDCLGNWVFARCECGGQADRDKMREDFR